MDDSVRCAIKDARVDSKGRGVVIILECSHTYIYPIRIDFCVDLFFQLMRTSIGTHVKCKDCTLERMKMKVNHALKQFILESRARIARDGIEADEVHPNWQGWTEWFSAVDVQPLGMRTPSRKFIPRTGTLIALGDGAEQSYYALQLESSVVFMAVVHTSTLFTMCSSILQQIDPTEVPAYMLANLPIDEE